MIGMCQHMCSKSEILLRERENLLHPFEVAVGHTPKCPRADYSRCVKEYCRPTVGKEDRNPAEVRPPSVLLDTVHYLIHSVATLKCPWNEIYDFIFDRLRAVRQDLVVQECEDRHAIEILEAAVRFHVYSEYRLCTEHISVFDAKINSQHAQECLKRLISLYNIRGNTSENRAEFEATYLLYNLGAEEALLHYLSLDVHLRHCSIVRQAYQMSIAFAANNWVRVLRMYANLSSTIHLCAVHRHFTCIQQRALHTMNAGYSSKNLTFPIAKLTELLFLNTDTETQIICEMYGVTVLGEGVQFFRGNFKSDEKVERSHCDFVNSQLKHKTIPEILKGKSSPLKKPVGHGNEASSVPKGRQISGHADLDVREEKRQSRKSVQGTQSSDQLDLNKEKQGRQPSEKLDLNIENQGRPCSNVVQNQGTQSNNIDLLASLLPCKLQGNITRTDALNHEFSKKCST
ncbi:SAC3 domain-containing protein 1-like isoform X2 [Dreissena polymorpha]|uniref:SAC3/GANP/THP3 conserved domain-containing protein n=1 Tax=Dreissena polymorpha TaxID=45954 RepID=A0A9D4MDL2_DREPO|nr:SAC3 domain-containing protein 1-like isoform X2 [Dreissena polymorpha]KAH3875617.1 hypothetical protein DPMN_038888 [Dreissena polymorpha]